MKLSVCAAAIAAALSVMTAVTDFAAPAAAAAPPPLTASAGSSPNGPFFCTVQAPGSSPVGGVSGSCTQFSVFVSLWVRCYNPYTRQYFRVASAWGGPDGVWYYTTVCPPGTFPAESGFDSVAASPLARVTAVGKRFPLSFLDTA